MPARLNQLCARAGVHGARAWPSLRRARAGRLLMLLMPALLLLPLLLLLPMLPLPPAMVHAGEALPLLKSVTVENTREGARLVMHADRAFSFDAQVLPDPYRLQIALPPVKIFSARVKTPEASLVRAARFIRHTSGRMMLDVRLSAPAYITHASAEPAGEGRPARMQIALAATDARVLARLLEGETAAADAVNAAATAPAPRARPASKKPRRKPGKPGSAELKAMQQAYRKLIEQAAATPASMEDLLASLPLSFEDEKPARAPQKAEKAEKAQKTKEIKETQKARKATKARGKDPRGRKGLATTGKPARPVIVIDAGHGGKDPGAVDKAGRKEKAIVLTFARALRAALKRRGYKVVMTRDDDTYLRLRERVEVARRHHASLFISIHADKFCKRGVRGLGIYTLSEKASDAEAAALAKMENAADLIGAYSLDEEDEELRGILVDLAQRETNANSHILASALVRALKRVTRLRRNPVRSAAFRVLKAPEIPSLLIELGYMTNPADVRNMRSRAWRRKVSDAMARTIDRFLKERVAMKQ